MCGAAHRGKTPQRTHSKTFSNYLCTNARGPDQRSSLSKAMISGHFDHLLLLVRGLGLGLGQKLRVSGVDGGEHDGHPRRAVLDDGLSQVTVQFKGHSIVTNWPPAPPGAHSTTVWPAGPPAAMAAPAARATTGLAAMAAAAGPAGPVLMAVSAASEPPAVKLPIAPARLGTTETKTDPSSPASAPVMN
jgi:hypothetical protein